MTPHPERQAALERWAAHRASQGERPRWTTRRFYGLLMVLWTVLVATNAPAIVKRDPQDGDLIVLLSWAGVMLVLAVLMPVTRWLLGQWSRD